MKISKRIVPALTASALLFTSLAFTSVPVQAEDVLFHSECEDAELTSDLQVTTNIYGTEKPGYTGDGFVWMQSSGTITFDVTVPETGMYDISMKYMQELSKEGRLQRLYINDKGTGSYMLPYCTDWRNYSFGVHKLNKGLNKIQIKSEWGFAYYDTFTVDYAKLDALDVKPVLSDSKATPEAQALMDYLCDVYGKNIVSGQQEIYGGGNDGDMELEFEWLKDLTGKYPAIRGFDYMNYNPLYGWDDGTTERIIEWVNERGGIATTSWHAHVPNDFAGYTLGDTLDWQLATYATKTDFDTAKCIVKGTKEYEFLQMTIDSMATELLALQEAGVPVVFRPFHEAEGNGGANGEGAWFWWASAGAEVYKEMWKMLYTKLTEEYGLHNLIWTYNSYVYDTSEQWYPGDEWVDIVGYDKYNTVHNRLDGLTNCPNEDAISSIFYKLVDLTDGKKMVAMTENDTIPNLENLTIEKAGWLYFCPWYGEFITSEANNYKATLIELYQSDYVLTLDELPDLKTYKSKKGGDNPGTYETGDLNCDGKVNIVDFALMKKYFLGVISEKSLTLANADFSKDGAVDIIDMIIFLNKMLTPQ